VLAVGDRECFERIHQYRRAGTTPLCVSPAPGTVQELCDRAIWLDHGELIMSGRIRDVIEGYEGHRDAATA
jgi:lipopolysaccharide transport system ATP-binding protein